MDFPSARGLQKFRQSPCACRQGVRYNRIHEDQSMSDVAVELIQTFSALSRSDQYMVLLELARISEVNAGPLSDE